MEEHSVSPFPEIIDVALDPEILEEDVSLIQQHKSISRPSSPFPKILDVTLNPEIVEQDVVIIKTTPRPEEKLEPVSFPTIPDIRKYLEMNKNNFVKPQYELPMKRQTTPPLKPEFGFAVENLNGNVVENAFSSVNSQKTIQSQNFESQGHFTTYSSYPTFVPREKTPTPPPPADTRPPLDKLIILEEIEVEPKNPIFEEHVKQVAIAGNKEKSDVIKSQKSCFSELQEIKAAYDEADRKFLEFTLSNQSENNEINEILNKMKRAREGRNWDLVGQATEDPAETENNALKALVLGVDELEPQTSTSTSEVYKSKEENTAESTSLYESSREEAKCVETEEIIDTIKEELSLETPSNSINLKTQPNNILTRTFEPKETEETFEPKETEESIASAVVANIVTQIEQGSFLQSEAILEKQSKKVTESLKEDFSTFQPKIPEEYLTKVVDTVEELAIQPETISKEVEETAPTNDICAKEPPQRRRKPPETIIGARPIFGQLDINTEFQKAFSGRQKKCREVSKQMNKIPGPQPKVEVTQSKKVFEESNTANSKLSTELVNNEVAKVETLVSNENEEIEKIFYQREREYHVDFQTVSEEFVEDNNEENYQKIPVKSLIKNFEQSAMPVMRYKQIRESFPQVSEAITSNRLKTNEEEEVLKAAEEEFENLFYVANSEIKTQYFSQPTTLVQSENSSFCRYQHEEGDFFRVFVSNPSQAVLTVV